MTLDGVTQQAVVAANGDFSATFTIIAGLSVSGSPYTVSYSYAGDATFAPASGTTTLTVTQATSTITWADPADMVQQPLLSRHAFQPNTSQLPGSLSASSADLQPRS